MGPLAILYWALFTRISSHFHRINVPSQDTTYRLDAHSFLSVKFRTMKPTEIISQLQNYCPAHSHHVPTVQTVEVASEARSLRHICGCLKSI